MSNHMKTLGFTILSLVCTSVIVAAKPLEITNRAYMDNVLEVGAGQSSLSICDVNGDGRQDAVFANYLDNNVSVFLGNGDGHLAFVGSYSVGERPTDLATADINDDGKLDLVVANHETDYVTVLFGAGNGQFERTSQSKLTVNIKPHPHAVQLSDLDDDGRVDLIIDDRDNFGLYVMRGLAGGSFKAPGKLIKAGGDPYRGFAIGDINTDGKLDMVTPNQRSIGLLLNTNPSQLTFSLAELRQAESPFAVELSDINGDKQADLIVATGTSTVSMLPGDGKGNFLHDRKVTISTANGAKQIATGDLNGDGVNDALVTSWSGEVIAILGAVSGHETLRFSHSRIPNPWGVGMADFNQDGMSDFIIADGQSNLAVLYVSGRLKPNNQNEAE